jgi:hypothetical protein
LNWIIDIGALAGKLRSDGIPLPPHELGATHGALEELAQRQNSAAIIRPLECLVSRLANPGSSQCPDHGAKLDYLKIGWTFGPIMAPTNDDITAAWRMTMHIEVAAFVLELNSHLLPLTSPNLPLRLAVRESRLNSLNEIAKLVGDHAEEENDTVLVDWFMSQPTEVYRVAKERTGGLGLGAGGYWMRKATRRDGIRSVVFPVDRAGPTPSAKGEVLDFATLLEVKEDFLDYIQRTLLTRLATALTMNLRNHGGERSTFPYLPFLEETLDDSPRNARHEWNSVRAQFVRIPFVDQGAGPSPPAKGEVLDLATLLEVSQDSLNYAQGALLPRLAATLTVDFGDLGGKRNTYPYLLQLKEILDDSPSNASRERDIVPAQFLRVVLSTHVTSSC